MSLAAGLGVVELEAIRDARQILLALAALALAAAVMVAPPAARRVRPRPGPAARDPRLRQWVRQLVRPIAAFLAVTVIAPGLWWAGLGLAAGLALLRADRARWPTRGSARRRALRRRWLIVHAELLAAALDSGLAMATALRAVSEVLGAQGPSAGQQQSALAALDSVAAMLALGADTDTAWRAVDADADLVPLAAAARRSAVGGTTLADAVREHAAQLREQAREESVRSAGRAGVLMTAPLGVCFLPAFLCLGLAPVVLGLLGRLTIH